MQAIVTRAKDGAKSATDLTHFARHAGIFRCGQAQGLTPRWQRTHWKSGYLGKSGWRPAVLREQGGILRTIVPGASDRLPGALSRVGPSEADSMLVKRDGGQESDDRRSRRISNDTSFERKLLVCGKAKSAPAVTQKALGDILRHSWSIRIDEAWRVRRGIRGRHPSPWVQARG